jgi:hypothetical protein
VPASDLAVRADQGSNKRHICIQNGQQRILLPVNYAGLRRFVLQHFLMRHRFTAMASRKFVYIIVIMLPA